MYSSGSHAKSDDFLIYKKALFHSTRTSECSGTSEKRSRLIMFIVSYSYLRPWNDAFMGSS